MSYNNISRSGFWNDAADNLNYNFNKISSQITDLQEKLVKAKGLFETVEELKAKYPHPVLGDWAIIGNTLPGEIYIANELEQWVSTGQMGGDIDVNLIDYLKSEIVENVISILDDNKDPLVLTSNITPKIDEFTGEDKSVSITWNVMRGNLVVSDLYSLIIKMDDVNIETSQLPVGTFQTKVNKLGTTKFKVIASTKEAIDEVDLEYNQIVPMYIGTSTENAASKIDPTSFEKQELKLEPAGTYNLTTSVTPEQYLWICIPGNIGEITEVKVGEEETVVNLEKPVIGNLGLYKNYRTTDPLGLTESTGLKIIII